MLELRPICVSQSFGDVSFDTVTYLLHHGANPNIPDKIGITPLHLACELGDVRLFDVLIEYGASVHAIDDEGETPLFYALRGQHVDVVKRLFECGIDFNTRNSDGESVLEFCTSIQDTEMVNLLESLQSFVVSTVDHKPLNPRSLSMEIPELNESSSFLSGSNWISNSGELSVKSSF
eukprot:TRINITY_DN3525_c0_g1_i6.p1 TRINITY_DN3525_c0_g1~~TRINITY_DN3525_c0_g1_i6.p1  ORF type:complete len:177 (+),score=25.54 TRINITY_DN3525_c0_g1_i6:260-790(+)